MGVFDGVGGLKGLLGQVEAAAAPALVSALLAKTDLGSLQGVVAKLQAAGLNDPFRSTCRQRSIKRARTALCSRCRLLPKHELGGAKKPDGAS